MKFPWGRGYETVDFPTRHSRHIPIPHLWLSSCDGRLIPTTRGFASRGRNQSSITPATPCVGNWDVPFVTCGEIIFPTTRGFATRGRKYPVPYPLPQGNGTFLLKKYLIATSVSGKFFLMILQPILCSTFEFTQSLLMLHCCFSFQYTILQKLYN